MSIVGLTRGRNSIGKGWYSYTAIARPVAVLSRNFPSHTSKITAAPAVGTKNENQPKWDPSKREFGVSTHVSNQQSTQQTQTANITTHFADRLALLEQGLLLHNSPVHAPKFVFETKSETGPYQKQDSLELKSITTSVDRFRAIYEDVVKIGKGAALGAAYRYMISWYEPLYKSIESEQHRLSQVVVSAINQIEVPDTVEGENAQPEENPFDNPTMKTAEEETPMESGEQMNMDEVDLHTDPLASESTEAAQATPPSTTDPLTGLEQLPPYLHQFLSLSPQKLAVIAMHTCISMMLQAPTGLPFNRVAMAVGNAIQADYVLERVKLQDKKFFKMLVKRLGGRLSVHKLNKHSRTWIEEKWDTKTVIQLGGAVIDHLIKHAIVVEPNTSTKLSVFEKTPTAPRSAPLLKIQLFMIKEVLRDPKLLREMVPALFLPVVVPPKPWTAPLKGGYLHLKTRLMRIKDFKAQMGPVIDLWKVTNVMDPLFEGLNILGKTAWKLNKEVFDVVKTAWDNGGDIAELPSRVDRPVPPVSPEYSQKEWWRLLKKIAQHNANLHSLRCDLLLKLAVARDYQDEKLYFPHNVDFRGRAYPLPAHLNHMGADICRGLLVFYEPKPLGAKGLTWLKIHLANLFGMDKIPFDERAAFVDRELDNIFDSAMNPLTGRKWWLRADAPWQCLAACKELKKALDSGDPENFLSHLPIHQDGTCNGLQHYAALGGDVMGAKQVNLLPSDRPQDVYTGVARLVAKRIDEDAAAGNKLAQQLAGKITRKIVKQTVMTSVYGVTYIGARAQIANAIKDHPNLKEFYLDDSKLFLVSSYVTKHTFASLKEMFLGARLIMDWLNQCARVIGKTNMPVMWISPIGVPVIQPYRKETPKDYVTTVVQAMRLKNSNQLPINVTRQRTALPPNLIHSLDSSHMMFTALECDKAGITYASVHDSYWTHACSVDTMSQILRNEFINLHKQPLLEMLLESFKKNYPHIKEYPPLPKRGDLDLNEVAKSKYFFN